MIIALTLKPALMQQQSGSAPFYKRRFETETWLNCSTGTQTFRVLSLHTHLSKSGTSSECTLLPFWLKNPEFSSVRT